MTIVCTAAIGDRRTGSRRSRAVPQRRRCPHRECPPDGSTHPRRNTARDVSRLPASASVSRRSTARRNASLSAASASDPTFTRHGGSLHLQRFIIGTVRARKAKRRDAVGRSHQARSIGNRSARRGATLPVWLRSTIRHLNRGADRCGGRPAASSAEPEGRCERAQANRARQIRRRGREHRVVDTPRRRTPVALHIVTPGH